MYLHQKQELDKALSSETMINKPLIRPFFWGYVSEGVGRLAITIAIKSRWWFQTIFLCIFYARPLRKTRQVEYFDIFQMGWNLQLKIDCETILVI